MTTNPALAELDVLVGRWDMELFGAAFLPDPDTRVHGDVSIDWIEAGAALVMRQGEAATWIIGRDDNEPDFTVLYADSRGVSRVYRMSLHDRTWRLSRHTPEFSQRFQAEFSEDAQTISGRWEKSFDGGHTWEHDFNITYHRRPEDDAG
jgi:hypothetical protein